VQENSDGGVGVLGTCSVARVGGPCGRQGSYAECPLGAYCEAATRTCRQGALGTPCGYNVHCPPGLFCGATGLCARQIAVGSPCSSPNDELQCAPPGHCRSTGDGGVRCVAAVGSGAACTRSDECKFGLACVAGACVSAGHQGEPCWNTDLCFDGFCAGDGGTNDRCTSRHMIGESCVRARDCTSNECLGAYSEPGVCRSTCP
jgi:hypothetical protein